MKFKELLKNKKFIIPAVAVIALLVILVLPGIFKPKAAMTSLQSTELKKGPLVNSISLSGNIESETSRNIYAKVSSSVEKIYVKVGDKVKAGEKLAQLDTENLSLELAQQRETAKSSKTSTNIDYKNKKSNYDIALSQYKNALNSELINAQEVLRLSEVDLNNKKTAYDNNKELYEMDDVSRYELDQSEIAYNTALKSYEKAQKALKTTKTRVKQELENSKNGVVLAKAGVDNRSTDLGIQKLAKSLNDATVRTPVKGTVTAVNALEGASPTGVMFVVEDTNKLVVTSKVKEYDAGRINIGQKVNVRTDATGDKVLKGEVISVAPAALKDAGGALKATTSPEFEVKVAIKTKSKNLKIGMSARIEVIISEVNDVYSVPYEALTKNEAGEDIVYEIIDNNGTQETKELKVIKGMETDIYVEISGENLKDGMKIANDGEAVKMKSKVGAKPQENMPAKSN